MKGGLGLALATALGIVGAVCNWLYLERLARQQETVSFIAVRSNVQLEVGDAFKDSHLMRVDIPRSGVGNLDRIAPLWSAKEAVIGERANRPFAGGEIILESDLVTPPSRISPTPSRPTKSPAGFPSTPAPSSPSRSTPATSSPSKCQGPQDRRPPAPAGDRRPLRPAPS